MEMVKDLEKKLLEIRVLVRETHDQGQPWEKWRQCDCRECRLKKAILAILG